jgi:hypothetical protein
MDLKQQKQEFSRAYVKAVAAACGYATFEHSTDDDSIDLGISNRGGNGTTRSPRLELQLKCTGRDVVGDLTVDFPLKLKNYDDLRPTNLMVPRILVVVKVPQNVDEWTVHSEAELLLRHCGYWYSLRGMPSVENVASVTVNIPRTQLFNVAGLQSIMNRIANEQLP